MPGKTNAVPLDARLKALEERLQITLTDHERMLLTTSKSLLSPRESQEAFLLGIALGGRQCPACLSTICQHAAARGGLDLGKHTPDDDYECPRCHAHLTWMVPLMGEPFFTISPDEARPVRS